MIKQSAIRIVAAALFAGAVALIGQSSPVSAEDAGAKALAAADNAWSKLAVARDVNGVASYYAEDAIAYPPNEPAAVGRAAIRKVWAGYFGNPSFQISWTATAAGADKRIGWTAGTYQDSYKGADGKTVAERGKYVTVWRKGANGKWQAIHDIWNSNGK